MSETESPSPSGQLLKGNMPTPKYPGQHPQANSSQQRSQVSSWLFSENNGPSNSGIRSTNTFAEFSNPSAFVFPSSKDLSVAPSTALANLAQNTPSKPSNQIIFGQTNLPSANLKIFGESSTVFNSSPSPIQPSSVSARNQSPKRSLRSTDIPTKFAGGPRAKKVHSTSTNQEKPLQVLQRAVKEPRQSTSNSDYSEKESEGDSEDESEDEDSENEDSEMISSEDEDSPIPVRMKTKQSHYPSTGSAEENESKLRAAHLQLLSVGEIEQDVQQTLTTPIFTHSVLKATSGFTQYGFLAGNAEILEQPVSNVQSDTSGATQDDPRLYFNTAPPSSVFICGSQGSGKSHTLSCLLENSLMKSVASQLDNPLGALVFHYDSFTSDVRGDPCEAAYLASDSRIKVRVLCSPTNIATMRRTYADLNVKIEPLQIDQSHLSTKRMLDLMAVNPENGPMPLYLHAINRILREMRIDQQASNGSFNYGEFKRRVEGADMTPAQKAPLAQRLDTLESFMHSSQTKLEAKVGTKPRKHIIRGNNWAITPGSLTIVDLSCPCVTSEGACALFNICLGIFLEQECNIGRVVALDEAHKYMNTSSEADTLTQTLLSAIRLQRHLGTRIFISTQEPTISPALLDLCSVTIVHRFSSPEWLRCLRLHLAALDDTDYDQKADVKKVFNKIVKLRVGEALLFAPSAIIGVDRKKGAEERTKKLGVGYLRIRVRARVTEDGGKSVMAH